MEIGFTHIKSNGQWLRVVEKSRDGTMIFIRPLYEKEADTGQIVIFDTDVNQIALRTQ
jgi:hypothetical protein